VQNPPKLLPLSALGQQETPEEPWLFVALPIGGRVYLGLDLGPRRR
jgi:hypothetical protein